MFCEKCGSAMIKVEKVHNCTKCNHVRFENAIPVAIVLIPVLDDNEQLKLVAVRRGESPKIGEIALPGGFQEIESAIDAGIREVKEETGIDVEISSSEDVLILTTPDNKRNLMFFIAHLIDLEDVQFKFKTKETLEILLIDESTKLAFPLHEKAVKWFYANNAYKY